MLTKILEMLEDYHAKYAKRPKYLLTNLLEYEQLVLDYAKQFPMKEIEFITELCGMTIIVSPKINCAHVIGLPLDVFTMENA